MWPRQGGQVQSTLRRSNGLRECRAHCWHSVRKRLTMHAVLVVPSMLEPSAPPCNFHVRRAPLRWPWHSSKWLSLVGRPPLALSQSDQTQNMGALGRCLAQWEQKSACVYILPRGSTNTKCRVRVGFRLSKGGAKANDLFRYNYGRPVKKTHRRL